MTDLLSSIIAEKGIDAIVGYLKGVIPFENEKQIINNCIHNIESKLDTLINAPFKEAIIYYNEGNIQKFKERIIAAIALDDMNIPARIAYIYILCSKNRYGLAAQYYWDLYVDFTLRKSLFPNQLYSIFSSILGCESYNLIKDLSLSVNKENFSPLKFYKSNFYFIITWGKRNHFWGYSRIGCQYIICYTWGGEIIFMEKVDSCEVKFMSLRYILYKSNGYFYLYDLKKYNINKLKSDVAIRIFDINNVCIHYDYDFEKATKEKIIMDNIVVKQGPTLKGEGSYETPDAYDGGEIHHSTTRYYTFKYGTVSIKKRNLHQ